MTIRGGFMLSKKIINYFLDKPGAYEFQEADRLKLNVASKEFGILKEGPQLSLEVKLNRQDLKSLENKFTFESQDVDKDQIRCSISIDDHVSIGDLYELLDLSYDNVLSELPEDEKNELLDLEW